ncbi:PAS domain S-box protein [Thiovibrio sp. JS02]
MQTQKIAYGIELERSGRFILRVVLPWLREDKPLGYLALAQDMDPFVLKLKEYLDCEVLLTAQKSFVDRNQWLSRQNTSARAEEWKALQDCVVTAKTTATVPGALCGYLVVDNSAPSVRVFDFQEDSRHFRGGIVDIFVDGPQRVGSLVILRDVTSEVVSIWSMALYLGIVGGGGIVVLFLFFSFYIAGMDRKIAATQETLHDAIADRDSELSESSLVLQNDIAKRQEVEREFGKICQQNQLILDSVGEGIFGLDLQGRHTFVNPQAARMLGYEVQELVGQPSHPLWHHRRANGEPFPAEECPIHHTLRDGKLHRVEDDAFWRKDGTSFPVDYTSTPIWENGRLAGAVVSFKDIAVRKKALHDLEVSENRYRTISNTAQDAIILMDDRGRIAYWNPAAEKIFGYTPVEALGRDLHELIMPARFVANMKDGMARFRKTGTGEVVGRILELTGMRKGHIEFPVELSVSALEQDGTWWAVGVARDISERVQARRERDELQAQLRQSQKMEAIGTLAGGIAHDFNNILGAIMGYTELALLEVGEGKPRENLEEVRKASRRAKDLVAHILAFSRQSEMARKPVDVSPIIKETLKMLRASLPSTIEIRQTIGSELGRIMADPTQIHQVLMNLCTNAAHAMREQGGLLEIGLDLVVLRDESILRLFSIEPGKYLRLSVRDNGIGIDPAIQNKIFDPFFTTKDRGEGTGMGLSVVHGIVTSHGGAIELDSEPGVGTAFSLYFPILETVTETVEAVVVDAPPSGRERVLFVDDELPLIELGERILTYLGYQVTARTSSVDALALFRNEPDSFDLIVTDYTMPNMTGGELARQMLAIRPDIPIILCTGFSEVFTEEKAKALGIKGYVMKPLSIHDLAQTCRSVLDSSKG